MFKKIFKNKRATLILIYLFYFFHIASSYSSAEAHLDE